MNYFEIRTHSYIESVYFKGIDLFSFSSNLQNKLIKKFFLSIYIINFWADFTVCKCYKMENQKFNCAEIGRSLYKSASVFSRIIPL